MRRPAALLVPLLALAALAACRDDGETVTAGDGEPTATTAPPTTGGTTDGAVDGPAGLVLQVHTGGGFVPVEYAFGSLPELSLYRDGRVIAIGPTTLEFPGRALPNVLVGRVDADEVATAVGWAKEAGVTENPDFGQPPVADAPSTSVVLVDGGRTYRVDAYALGEFPDSPGVTPAQRESRRRLQGLRDRLADLAAAADQPYRATAVSVLVRPYPEPGPGEPPAEPAPGEADWPLADLAAGGAEQFGGRCLGFTGAEAERVLAAAEPARSNTRWRSGGAVWAVAFRPGLPDVAPCSPTR